MSDHKPRQLAFTETRGPIRLWNAERLLAMTEDAVRDVEECVALVNSYSVPDGALTVKIVVEQKMKPKEADNG